VTPNYTPGGLGCGCNFVPDPLGVWYDGGVKGWAVFTENVATMPTGESFNVLVVPKASRSVFAIRATKSDTHGDYVFISSLTNGKPTAAIQVAQVFNPGDASVGRGIPAPG
jgi:hypothetical protein